MNYICNFFTNNVLLYFVSIEIARLCLMRYNTSFLLIYQYQTYFHNIKLLQLPIQDSFFLVLSFIFFHLASLIMLYTLKLSVFQIIKKILYNTNVSISIVKRGKISLS